MRRIYLPLSAWAEIPETVIDGGIDLICWREAMGIFCLREDVSLHCTI